MDPDKKSILAFTNLLLFETPGGIRFTQDSPILPNVWLAFAVEPHKQQELILTTTRDGGTGQAAAQIRKMLKQLNRKRREKKKPERELPRVSYIPGQIAVRIYFDELMRVVLPLTPWWHENYDALRKLERSYSENAEVADWIPFPQPDEKKQRERDLVDALMLMRREIDLSVSMQDSTSDNQHRTDYINKIPPELGWFVRICGLIADCFSSEKNLLERNSLSEKLQLEFEDRHEHHDTPDVIENSEQQERRRRESKIPVTSEARKIREGIVTAFTELYEGWGEDEKYPGDRLIWRITKNRPVRLAVEKSALTVKADAAARLFDISCNNITWAVLDSGIDANHPAFRLLSAEHEKEARLELAAKKSKSKPAPKIGLSDVKRSRVVKTLDFTRLRELLDFDFEEALSQEEKKDTKNRNKERKTTSKSSKTEDSIIPEIARRMKQGQDNDQPNIDYEEKAAGLLNELRRRIEDGKDISWQDLEEAIVDNNPETPVNDHGTHVAGILGADWIDDNVNEHELPFSQRTRVMRGVCPDINLIDVRVFRQDGLTDEFELLAAVQYLRWMNSRAGTMQVHGANLSLSLVHEVRRFACGRTPICEECNEAAALGMVIVAAAGNRGFEQTDLEEIRSTDSYKSVSITDPGNAEGVITVGATHRKRPHEYGVSYFSSRGPTGDGRLKPDLVAPGEKIKGPTPNGRSEYKDGTSMAAPHVSGAAALLMARHTELISQPEMIKTILCENATDLGRERYFQGHGLVDALRAIQSV